MIGPFTFIYGILEWPNTFWLKMPFDQENAATLALMCSSFGLMHNGRYLTDPWSWAATRAARIKASLARILTSLFASHAHYSSTNAFELRRLFWTQLQIRASTSFVESPSITFINGEIIGSNNFLTRFSHIWNNKRSIYIRHCAMALTVKHLYFVLMNHARCAPSDRMTFQLFTSFLTHNFQISLTELQSQLTKI